MLSRSHLWNQYLAISCKHQPGYRLWKYLAASRCKHISWHPTYPVFSRLPPTLASYVWELVDSHSTTPVTSQWSLLVTLSYLSVSRVPAKVTSQAFLSLINGSFVSKQACWDHFSYCTLPLKVEEPILTFVMSSFVWTVTLHFTFSKWSKTRQW